MTESPSPQKCPWWQIKISINASTKILVGVFMLATGIWIVIQWPLSNPFGFFFRKPLPPQPLPSPASQAISAIGRLEPEGEVIRVSAPGLVEGAKVEKLLVALGDQVVKGQVIAILDNHERMLRALELAIQQLNVAKTRLDQVKAGAKRADIQARASRVQELQQELEGQRATQIATIQRLDYELKHAEKECQRYDYLFENGAISASQRDNICLSVDTIQQQRQEAQAQLKLTQKTLNERINEARLTKTAIAEVRTTDVAVVVAEMNVIRSMIKQAEADLALTLVRSPRDGQILKINTKAGERVSSEGIVELGNTRVMKVVAEVYETDISQVKIGQSANISTQGLIKDLEGQVDEVGLIIGKKDLLGTDPAAASDARVVEVKIKLTPESSQVARKLTNLQVDVVINPESLRY
ncbi:MAG: ABC exporter membrane fusion protein [Snowella sp.]|nr:ABC exporter membrane fusion protein [Snowella sp.]